MSQRKVLQGLREIPVSLCRFDFHHRNHPQTSRFPPNKLKVGGTSSPRWPTWRGKATLKGTLVQWTHQKMQAQAQLRATSMLSRWVLTCCGLSALDSYASTAKPMCCCKCLTWSYWCCMESLFVTDSFVSNNWLAVVTAFDASSLRQTALIR